jgi:5-methylcytosine-specific restriction protein B
MRVYYGPPGTGKTVVAVRAAVGIADPAFAPTATEDEERLAQYFQRFFELEDEGRVDFITFSPGTQYETVVEAIRPVLGIPADPDDGGEPAGNELGYHYWVGPLLQLIRRAADNAENSHVLVVDEINRADISQVLGPLIASIEADKRLGAAFPVPFQLRYSTSAGKEYIPANLHLIGTMNSADRNIALVDVALRRRFEFVRLDPRLEMLRTTESTPAIDTAQLLHALNARIVELLGPDYAIGHSYFIGLTRNGDVIRVFATQIIPLLEEYFYGDDVGLLLVLGEHPTAQEAARIYDATFRDTATMEEVFGSAVGTIAAAHVTGATGTAGIVRRLRPSFWDMSADPPKPGDEAAAAMALRKIYKADTQLAQSGEASAAGDQPA